MAENEQQGGIHCEDWLCTCSSDGCCRRDETVPLRIGRHRHLALVFVFCAAVEDKVLNEEKGVETECEEAQSAAVQGIRRQGNDQFVLDERQSQHAGEKRAKRTAFRDCL